MICILISARFVRIYKNDLSHIYPKIMLGKIPLICSKVQAVSEEVQGLVRDPVTCQLKMPIGDILRSEARFDAPL